ncbi:unnamed protein product [Urochloa decumbens]|uniref:Uncharacterized protein n=1 Tax=Urochloa decumbens TaxID=240449 RepID=A0ABC8WJ96_9POAL
MPPSRFRSNQTREKMKMIAAVCWIPKGAFKNVRFATEEEINEALKAVIASDESSADSDYDDDDDMDDIADGDQEEDGDLQTEGVTNALSKDKPEDSSLDDIDAAMHKLKMHCYDNDEEGKGDLYYSSNDMDPYLKNDDMDDYEDDEEIEDGTVKPNELIIAGLHAHKKHSGNYLKVSIVEELMDGELCTGWSNHKIGLAHTPLCLAWSDCSLKDDQKGNFMAVGTISTEIQIWDLDIVDAVTPHTVLGGKVHKERKRKKGSHKDSILGIAWNKEYMNILASASADKTVKIWDVAASKCVTTLKHHDDKVQVVSWSQHSPEIILSGSFDKSVALKDVKNCASDCIRWSVEADVETVAWDPHNEHSFVVSLENGMVQAFDKRKSSSNDRSSSSALFTLHAHEKAVTSISFGPSAPNFLATSSYDKTVKLWDISSNQPSCIASLNPKLGVIFSVSFSNDEPFLLAMGGSKGKIKVNFEYIGPKISGQ